MVPALDTGDGYSGFELMHAHKAGQKQAHPDRAIIGHTGVRFHTPTLTEPLRRFNAP
jgi:hypothetical protein